GFGRRSSASSGCSLSRLPSSTATIGTRLADSAISRTQRLTTGLRAYPSCASAGKLRRVQSGAPRSRHDTSIRAALVSVPVAASREDSAIADRPPNRRVKRLGILAPFDFNVLASVTTVHKYGNYGECDMPPKS